ncbi:MAG: YecA family protein [Candidatus Bipolaricaulia bacterium]
MASVSLSPTPSIERVALRVMASLLPLIVAWGILAPVYSGVIFQLGTAVLGLDPTVSVTIAENVSGVPTVYQLANGAEQPVFRFDRVGLFYNTIVLLALMLAVPGWGWRRRAPRLGIALGLLALTHVGFVALQTKAQFINQGLIATPNDVAYAVNWLAVLFGPIGKGLFPLAIAFGLSWPNWAETFGLRIGLRQRQPLGRVGRNDPCPCGSGRKHKRCCGSR